MRDHFVSALAQRYLKNGYIRDMDIMKRTQPILDVLIIHGGPAGLTVALTLAWQRLTVTVFDSGDYRGGAVRHLHRPYFCGAARENMSGKETTTLGDIAIEKPKKAADGYFKAIGKHNML